MRKDAKSAEAALLAEPDFAVAVISPMWQSMWGDGNMVHAANPERGVVLDPLRINSVVFYGRPY